MPEMPLDQLIEHTMGETLRHLRVLKSPDRTLRDRYIAICTTKMEELYAFYRVWIMENPYAKVEDGRQEEGQEEGQVQIQADA